MKKLILAIIFFPLSLLSQDIEVLNKKYSIKSKSESAIYVAFEKGDVVTFNFTTNQLKELYEFSIVEFETNAIKFYKKNISIELLKKINIDKRSVYKFIFKNTQPIDLIIILSLFRKPDNENSKYFKTDVKYIKVFDTSYVQKKEKRFVRIDTTYNKTFRKVVEKKDSAIVMLIDRVSRVVKKESFNISTPKIIYNPANSDFLYTKEITNISYSFNVLQNIPNINVSQKTDNTSNENPILSSLNMLIPFADVLLPAIKYFTNPPKPPVIQSSNNKFVYFDLIYPSNNIWYTKDKGNITTLSQSAVNNSDYYNLILTNKNINNNGIDVDIKVMGLQIETYYKLEETLTPQYTNVYGEFIINVPQINTKTIPIVAPQ